MGDKRLTMVEKMQALLEARGLHGVITEEGRAFKKSYVMTLENGVMCSYEFHGLGKFSFVVDGVKLGHLFCLRSSSGSLNTFDNLLNMCLDREGLMKQAEEKYSNAIRKREARMQQLQMINNADIHALNAITQLRKADDERAGVGNRKEAQ